MATWQDRLRDARRFWDVAEAVDDPEHGNQAASNAILAAIAANDAVCMFLGRRRPAGDSHSEAAQVLQEICQSTQWAPEAAEKARQLLELTRLKNAVQYHGTPLRREQIGKIMKQAERFIEWVQAILPPTNVARGPE